MALPSVDRPWEDATVVSKPGNGNTAATPDWNGPETIPGGGTVTEERGRDVPVAKAGKEAARGKKGLARAK